METDKLNPSEELAAEGIVKKEKFIALGIDFGTAFTYAGIYKDNKFEPIFNIDTNEYKTGCPTVIWSDSDKKIHFGSLGLDKYNQAEKNKNLYKNLKVNLLEYIANPKKYASDKEISIVKIIRWQLRLLKIFCNMARACFDDAKIGSICIGMPALHGAKKDKFERLLKYLAIKAVVWANSTTPKKSDDGATSERATFTEQELDGGYDEKRFKKIVNSVINGNCILELPQRLSIVIESEPSLALKGHSTVANTSRSDDNVLCIDIGGGSLDLSNYKNDQPVKEFLKYKYKSVNLGATVFDKDVEHWLARDKEKRYRLGAYNFIKTREWLLGRELEESDQGLITRAQDVGLDRNTLFGLKPGYDFYNDSLMNMLGNIEISNQGAMKKLVAEEKDDRKGTFNDKYDKNDPNYYAFFKQAKERIEKTNTIDKIVLMGGGSEMKPVKLVLEQVFDNVPMESINIETGTNAITTSNAVALGASVVANNKLVSVNSQLISGQLMFNLYSKKNRFLKNQLVASVCLVFMIALLSKLAIDYGHLNIYEKVLPIIALGVLCVGIVVMSVLIFACSKDIRIYSRVDRFFFFKILPVAIFILTTVALIYLIATGVWVVV